MADNLIIACSNCFKDVGLRIDAQKFGKVTNKSCPNCGTIGGAKLDTPSLSDLAFSFFTNGAFFKSTFGGASAIKFNESHFNHDDDIDFPYWLKDDAKLIGQLLRVGFFHYGPRLWTLGHIRQLELLQTKKSRHKVIDEIIARYPSINLNPNTFFYRLRKNPNKPSSNDEYDSPPDNFLGHGRLDSRAIPILYGSQDVEICVHECRVTTEDELYLATLKPTKDLALLNLMEWIEEDSTEFESLNLSIHMLFSAPEHSYEIIREIAIAVKKHGYDGLVYPSYFSSVHRKNEPIENIGLFGRPIKDGLINVTCINRLLLENVNYSIHFGPVSF